LSWNSTRQRRSDKTIIALLGGWARPADPATRSHHAMA